MYMLLNLKGATHFIQLIYIQHVPPPFRSSPHCSHYFLLGDVGYPKHPNATLEKTSFCPFIPGIVEC